MKPFKLAVLLFTTSLFSPYAFSSAYKGDAMINPYNWTGYYIGLNAGGVRHTLDMTDNNATSFNATIQQATNPRYTAGLQAGYRRQLDLNKASGVIGGEFSANFSNSAFSKIYGSPFSLYQLHSENELKQVYLFQLIGGLAADRILLFLAGGLSIANISGHTVNLDGIPFFNSFSVSKKVIGTIFGAGIEYANNDKLSVRFKVDVITPNTYSTSDHRGDHFQISNRIAQATLGVNYKIG